MLSQKYVDKVLVCDDGSSDMTKDLAESVGAFVIRHDRNMGKGAALRSLLKKARELDADIVVTLDGDDQHDPNDIPRLIEPVLKENVDITVGSRFLEKDVEMPFYRKLGTRVLNKLVNNVGGRGFSDTQSGYRAYSRKAMEKIEINSLGIGVDSQILMDACSCGMKIKEIPIKCKYEGVRGPTHNPVKHGMNVVGTIISYVSLKRPLLTFGLPGVTVLGVGLWLFLHVLDVYFTRYEFAIGTMLASMIAILAGTFSILTAIILHAIASSLRANGNSNQSQR